jgi:hypothetical protein
MERNKAKECWISPTGLNMMVNLVITKLMDSEFTSGLMEEFSQATGNKTKCMAVAQSRGQMDANLQGYHLSLLYHLGIRGR